MRSIGRPDVDPCKTRDELIADDENQAFGEAVVAGWEELCEHLRSPAVTAAEALKVFHGELYDQDLVALRQTFQDHAKDGKPLTAGRIGYWLRSIKDTVFGDPGKKLVRSEDAHSKVSRWGVRDASIPTANPTQPTTTQQSGRPSDNCSAGDAGDAGDDLLYPHAQENLFLHRQMS